MHELYRGSGGMLLGKMFLKIELSEGRHIVHFLDRMQLISLVIHYSPAEVQWFKIPKFLKQRLMILTCSVTMIHDSASTPDSFDFWARRGENLYFSKSRAESFLRSLIDLAVLLKE